MSSGPWSRRADHRYERNELGQIVDSEQSSSFHQLSGSRRPADDADHRHAGGHGGSPVPHNVADVAAVRPAVNQTPERQKEQGRDRAGGFDLTPATTSQGRRT